MVFVSENDELEERFLHGLREEAARKGVDPELFTKDTVEAEQVDRKVHVKWKDIEFNLPGPGKAAVDAWFDKYGGVIVGAVVVLAGVAVGAKLKGD